MNENEHFQLTWHDTIAVVSPSPAVETLPEAAIESAARMFLSVLEKSPPSELIVDLSRVPFFGSAFFSFLLQCHRVMRGHNGDLHLAGCAPKVKELMHLMNFDTLWAIYDTRQQALEALG